MRKCSICYKICIKLKEDDKIFNSSKHYLLCDSCIQIIPFVSKTDGLKIYLLNNDDMTTLKTLYFINDNNIILFRELDVITLTIKKYGTIDKLLIKIYNRDNKIAKIKLSKQHKIMDRKKKLIELLELNKLPFYYRGDPYLYINYGTISIESVVKNEYNKVKEKQHRTIVLAKELYNNNLPFDENIDACYNYINNIKCYTIPKVINDVKRLTKIQVKN